jgi:hypothetical protein
MLDERIAYTCLVLSSTSFGQKCIRNIADAEWNELKLHLKISMRPCEIEQEAMRIGELLAKKLLSLKPVVKTRRSYKRVGLKKTSKLFQGLTM